MSPDEFRRHGHHVVDWLADYFEHAGQMRVLPPVEPGFLEPQLPLQAPECGEPMEAILAAHTDLDVDMARTIWSLVTLDRWWRAIRHEITAALPAAGAIAAPRGGEPTVDILIPIYEGFGLVRDCVRSIRAFTDRPFRCVLLDDASSDTTHSIPP